MELVNHKKLVEILHFRLIVDLLQELRIIRIIFITLIFDVVVIIPIETLFLKEFKLMKVKIRYKIPIIVLITI